MWLTKRDFCRWTMCQVLVNTAINVKRDLFTRGRDSSTWQMRSVYMTTRKCQKRPMYVRERLVYVTNATCIYDNTRMSKETYAWITYTAINVKRDLCTWGKDSYTWQMPRLHMTPRVLNIWTIYTARNVKRDLCKWEMRPIYVTNANYVHDNESPVYTNNIYRYTCQKRPM